MRGRPWEMTDMHGKIDQEFAEMVEWVASIVTQYTITELWSLDFVYFHKVSQRAEYMQRQRMKQLKRQKGRARK